MSAPDYHQPLCDWEHNGAGQKLGTKGWQENSLSGVDWYQCYFVMPPGVPSSTTVCSTPIVCKAKQAKTTTVKKEMHTTISKASLCGCVLHNNGPVKTLIFILMMWTFNGSSQGESCLKSCFLRTNHCTAVSILASDTVFFCKSIFLDADNPLHLDCPGRKVVIGTEAQLTTRLVSFVRRRKQMQVKGPIRIFTAGKTAAC